MFMSGASAVEPHEYFRLATVSFIPGLIQSFPRVSSTTRQLRAVVSLTVTASIILEERNSVLASSSCLSLYVCFLGLVVTLIIISTSFELILISSSASH
jgi:hypothetical protein